MALQSKHSQSFHSHTSVNNNPNESSFRHCKISFATHREAIYSFSFVCPLTLIALVPFDISSLDAGHCGQKPVTNDPNKVDGLNECLTYLYFHTHLPRTLDLMLGYRHCDVRSPEHSRQCESNIGHHYSSVIKFRTPVMVLEPSPISC